MMAWDGAEACSLRWRPGTLYSLYTLMQHEGDLSCPDGNDETKELV